MPQSSSASGLSISVSGVISRPQPTQSSICFVEWGSLNIFPKKYWRNSS